MSPLELAEVEKLLVARRILPAESLAVRLVGSIGPNGSWALDRIDVERSPGRIVLVPRVRRVPGDFFIQMVVPLDRTVRLQVPAGRTRIEVHGRAGNHGTEVLVEEGVQRESPQAYVDLQAETMDGDDLVAVLRVEGRVADGFVEKLEVREMGADRTGPWRAPESAERTATGVEGLVTLRRAAGDPERRVQARAQDGQGTWSPVVESLLRAR